MASFLAHIGGVSDAKAFKNSFIRAFSTIYALIHFLDKKDLSFTIGLHNFIYNDLSDYLNVQIIGLHF